MSVEEFAQEWDEIHDRFFPLCDRRTVSAHSLHFLCTLASRRSWSLRRGPDRSQFELSGVTGTPGPTLEMSGGGAPGQESHYPNQDSERAQTSDLVSSLLSCDFSSLTVITCEFSPSMRATPGLLVVPRTT